MPMGGNTHEPESREIKGINNIFGNFLVNEGLYNEIEITKDNIYELADLVGGHVRINVYCPKCQEYRVFSCRKIPYYRNNEQSGNINIASLEKEIVYWQEIQNRRGIHPVDYSDSAWSWRTSSFEDAARIMTLKFICAMDNTHTLDYVVFTDEDKMMKIGQYPSFADLSFPELKEYRKVLTTENDKELKRAIGLFASGIGVGSFVYLRRIFERIIEVSGQRAIEKGSVEEGEFRKAHIDKKIKMLGEYLPKLLVNNTAFYGIVSKGIHELTEEECLLYFPVMQRFIIMILRQWEKIRRDKEEEKILEDSLKNIVSKVK